MAQNQEEKENTAYKVFQHEDIDLTKPMVAHLTAPPTGAASGPNGHHDDFIHRGTGHGVVTTIVPTPFKGANNALNITPVPFTLGGIAHASSDSSVSLMNMHAALPQLPFPEFDGSSPRLWRKKCETYFELYAVPKSFWTKLATMFFIGPAVYWLQSLEDPSCV